MRQHGDARMRPEGMPDDEPRLVIETSGKCCASYELRVFKQDDPDTEAAPGEVGELGGRGASLMLGYFDDQAATEDAFNKGGWFMQACFAEIYALHAAGKLKPLPIKAYPVEQFADALREIRDRKVRGRIVLTMK